MRSVLQAVIVSIRIASLPSLSYGQQAGSGADRSYLTWTAARATQVGRSTRVNGRVGGAFDFRITHTEHAYNYKIRATWLTSEVIRATARLAQLSERLSDEQTEVLVSEAEAAGDAVILVEIDPREGSGVIPPEWIATLQPKSDVHEVIQLGTSLLGLVVFPRERHLDARVRDLD